MIKAKFAVYKTWRKHIHTSIQNELFIGNILQHVHYLETLMMSLANAKKKKFERKNVEILDTEGT